MKKSLIYFLFIFLLSCSSSRNYKIVVLNDGKKGYVISCYEHRENCEREAEKLCQNNYEVHQFEYKHSLQEQPLGLSSNDLNSEDKFENEPVSLFEMTISCKVIAKI